MAVKDGPFLHFDDGRGRDSGFVSDLVRHSHFAIPGIKLFLRIPEWETSVLHTSISIYTELYLTGERETEIPTH